MPGPEDDFGASDKPVTTDEFSIDEVVRANDPRHNMAARKRCALDRESAVNIDRFQPSPFTTGSSKFRKAAITVLSRVVEGQTEDECGMDEEEEDANERSGLSRH